MLIPQQRNNLPVHILNTSIFHLYRHPGEIMVIDDAGAVTAYTTGWFGEVCLGGMGNQIFVKVDTAGVFKHHAVKRLLCDYSLNINLLLIYFYAQFKLTFHSKIFYSQVYLFLH